MTQQEFEHIAMQMRTRALNVAHGFGFSAEESEDVAQDVMLKLWAMHDRLQSTAPPESLAGIAARHCCIDRWRLKHQMEEYAEDSCLGEASDPHEQMEYKELERWLFRQIEQLPSTCGIILKMRQLERRELEEIAQLLGLTKASVSTLLARARRQLLDELKRRNRQ